MWGFGWLDKIADQVARLLVVIGLGSSVYGDEQSTFTCDTDAPGCEQICYNQFTKISHLRFWAFQMIALVSPILAFHFLATYFASQVLKIKAAREVLDGPADITDERREYEERRIRRRMRVVGNTKTKKVYSDGELLEIPTSVKIKLAYFVSTAARLAIEGTFLYVTFNLFRYESYKCYLVEPLLAIAGVKSKQECLSEPYEGLNFLWAEFPAVYPCRRDDKDVDLLFTCPSTAFQNNLIACWTSRPEEKTVFLRYMNVMSAVCFGLCLLELLFIPVKYSFHASQKKSSRIQIVTQYRDHPGVMEEFPKGELINMPRTRSRNSLVYSTHGHSDFPGPRESYYEDRDRLPQPPQHATDYHDPPNETTAKRFEEYRA